MEVSSSEFEELGPNQQRAVTELTRMLAKSWGEGSVVIAPGSGEVRFKFDPDAENAAMIAAAEGI